MPPTLTPTLSPDPASGTPSKDQPVATPPEGGEGLERPASEWLQGIETELGDMDAGKPPPARDDKGKFLPADKAKDKPVDKPAEKPEEKKVEGESQPEKPAEKPADIKPVKAAELRTAYEGLKKRVKEELEPEVQKLRAKVTEYESKGVTESGPLQDKIKTLEKRNEDLAKQLAFYDYTQDPEFVKNYEEPYAQAWQEAVSTFKQLAIKIPDGEDDLGDPKFTTRPADENDLLRFANMKLSDVDEEAQKMFGASAARAIMHIEKIKDLSAKHRRALDEAKNKAGEFKTKKQEENQKRDGIRAKAWADANKAMEAKNPRAYKPEEGDAEDAAAHLRGFALADLLFVGSAGLTPEQIEALPTALKDAVKAGKPLSVVQEIGLHALARLKMANHDRKVAQLKKANAKIAELQKALDEYEKSEPNAGRAGVADKPTRKAWDEVIEDEIRALDKG